MICVYARWVGVREGRRDGSVICVYARWVGVREGGREGERGFTLRAEIGHHDIFEDCLDGGWCLGLREGGRKGVDGGTEGRHGGDEGEVEGVVDVKSQSSRRLLGAGPEGGTGAGHLREGGREGERKGWYR